MLLAVVLFVTYFFVAVNFVSKIWTPRFVLLDLTASESISFDLVYTFTEGSYTLTFASQAESGHMKIAINDQLISQDSLKEPFQTQLVGPAIIRVLEDYYVDMYVTSSDGGTMTVDSMSIENKVGATAFVFALWLVVTGLTIFGYRKFV